MSAREVSLNFLDSPKYFLSQLANDKTPYPASDIAFVNNLVRGGPFVSGQNSHVVH